MKPEPMDFERRRIRMVDEQLRRRGIADTRVLAAMGEVPWEAFVPESEKGRAYYDGALPLSHGQTISQPLMVAMSAEALRLRGDETVLEIGAGSGYQAAVLSKLAKKVYAVEIIPELSRQVITYGLSEDADVTASNVRAEGALLLWR